MRDPVADKNTFMLLRRGSHDRGRCDLRLFSVDAVDTVITLFRVEASTKIFKKQGLSVLFHW